MSTTHRFINNDILVALEDLTEGETTVRMAFFDPPYNIGFKYSDRVKDRLPWDEYADFIGNTFEKLKPVLEADGSAFFLHYPEACARLLPIIESKGYRLHQWISWVYPTNKGHGKTKFTTAHRTVMWLTHIDCERPHFNPKADPQPYRDPTHHRVKAQIAKGSTGVIPYNWWEINKVAGNQHGGSEEHKGWYNQIPYDLLKRLVLSTTDQGDTVLDGFAGSCSMYPVCNTHHRHSILVDLDPESGDIFDEYIAKG